MTTDNPLATPSQNGGALTVGVVIPARNEEDFILSTLDSLTFQRVPGGPRVDPSAYEIVVVEGASTDATADRVVEFAAHSPVKITLLQEDEASMVAPRVKGMNHFLESETPPRYLVSADADTTFPPTWLSSAASLLDRGADLVSSAGYMSSVIWERCPRLTQRYLDHVGTLFFDPVTIEKLNITDQAYPFTEQVFLDFGRPVSDAGFAITTDCYVELGGFRQDYWDEERRSPLAAVGWPLMYRAELSARRIAYMRTPFWSTSPRRLVNEPQELFSASSYLGDIAAFRAVSDDKYAWLDHFADRLDLRSLQEYCLKYYVLQRCITIPQLLRKNSGYFGDLVEPVSRSIYEWHAVTADLSPGRILSFATDLCQEFGEALLERIPHKASPSVDQSVPDAGSDRPIPRPSDEVGAGTMRNPLSGFAPIVPR